MYMYMYIPASRWVEIVVGDGDTARQYVVPAGQWVARAEGESEGGSGSRLGGG